jgi:hypothetical protein
VVRDSELSVAPLPKSKLPSEPDVVLEASDIMYVTGMTGVPSRFKSATQTVVGRGIGPAPLKGAIALFLKASNCFSARLTGA